MYEISYDTRCFIMLTIRDFLSLDLVRGYRNLTGAPVPMHRPIEFVSVNDLPLDDFIRPNEMVISIATPYLKDDSLMMEFVEGLVQAKASIFLLADPDDDIVLTKNVASFAAEHELPILQIPWAIRFADIVETVLRKTGEDYDEFIEKINLIQQKLLQSFLDGTSLELAVKAISSTMNCTLVVTDSNEGILCGDGITKSMIQVPLKSGGHLYGYIYTDADIPDKDLPLLEESLSPILSLWFYRDEIIKLTQSQAKDDFIWSLINGSDPEGDDMKRAARVMDYYPNRSYVCIIGKIQPLGSTSDAWVEKWTDKYMHSICDDTAQIAMSSGHEIMVTRSDNAIVIFYEIISSGREQIIQFLDRIERNLGKYPGRIHSSWGISEIKEGPTDFRNYYLHAKLAEELCENDDWLNQRYFYESTLIYNLMSVIASDETFVQNAYEILAPLIEYDKSKKLSLMEVLRVYLSCKSISETARKLDRHRQTLLYQLEKIEDLTGMSLKNNDDLFLLEVCMRLQVDFSAVEEDTV